MGTTPSCCDAVHKVWRCAALPNVPLGAVQRYVTAQLIESITVAVRAEFCPTWTVQGSQPAVTDRSCAGAGAGAGGGGGGGAAAGGGGGGATKIPGPGGKPVRDCQSRES